MFVHTKTHLGTRSYKYTSVIKWTRWIIFLELITFANSLNSVVCASEALRERVTPVLKKSQEFRSWIQSKELYFSTCLPKKIESESHHSGSKTGVAIQLCDGTQIDVESANTLLKAGASRVEALLKAEQIALVRVCGATPETNASCVNPKAPNAPSYLKNFQDLRFLHGQFLPADHVLLVRSDASNGVLFHEWVHVLQATGQHKIDGKTYKKDRLAIQSDLTSLLDSVIAEHESNLKKLKSGEISSKVAEELSKALLPLAASIGTELSEYSKWQDLIDERQIHLVFTTFGALLNLSSQDEILASKNLAFICQRKDLRFRNRLPECQKTGH